MTTRGALFKAKYLTKAGEWSEAEPVSRREALRRIARYYINPEIALRESSSEAPVKTPFAIYWRAT